MGQRLIAAASLGAALLLAAAVTPSQAQSQPRPGQLPPSGAQQRPAQPQTQERPKQQAQQPAAAKPYKAVAITPPKPMADPSFEAFLKQVVDIADKKDRKALAALVSKSFFWMGEKGDQADKKKSGIDNLAKALELDGKDAEGWDTLANFASDLTATPFAERKDTICGPAQPEFNDDEFGALIKSTNTEDSDWGYPLENGLEMHAAPQPNSPVIEKIGLHFVRVMEDEAASNQQVSMLKIVSPSGKTGYVPADTISPLGSDVLCYAKEGGAWKIAGFAGGG